MDEREQLENELLKAQIDKERAQQRLAEEQLAEMQRKKEGRKAKKEYMEKKSMYFLVTWGEDKQRAWSGTNWGLFQALSRRMDVRDVDITVKNTLKERIINKLRRGRKSSDMGISSTLKGREIAMRAVKDGGPRDAVFQFAEVLPDSCGIPTYLYVDLTADYVGYMKQHSPDDFAVSNYEKCNKLTIVKRGGAAERVSENVRRSIHHGSLDGKRFDRAARHA